MEWLQRYVATTFLQAQSVSRLASRLNDGRPGPGFEALIGSTLRAAQGSGLLEETDLLGDVCVLPLGTPNSLFLPTDGPTRRRVYFHSGMHECLDGLLRILCLIESALPMGGFEEVNFHGATWQTDYRQLVEESLEQNPDFVHLGAALMAQFLMAGHPCNWHRIPMVDPGFVSHKVMFRFIEVFRIGHEIGHALIASTTQEMELRLPIRIGGADVQILKTEKQEELVADMIAYAIVAATIDFEDDSLPRELQAYASVAPDLALSLLSFVERCLEAVGWSRPAADLHASPVARRYWRRQFLKEQDDLMPIKFGEHFEIVLSALEIQVVPEIHRSFDATFPLGPAWRGECA